MANEEHLARLKQGVEAWNHGETQIAKYCRTSRGGPPEADLDGADLSRANLTGAHLTGRSSPGRTSSGRISRGGPHGADLTGATSAGRTSLRQGNLTGATPQRGGPHQALLKRRYLGMLTSARFEDSKRDSMKVLQPSAWRRFITRGNIPEVFLRGAGVPDDMITYMNRWSATHSSITPALSAIPATKRVRETPTCRPAKQGSPRLVCAGGLEDRGRIRSLD